MELQLCAVGLENQKWARAPRLDLKNKMEFCKQDDVEVFRQDGGAALWVVECRRGDA